MKESVLPNSESLSPPASAWPSFTSQGWQSWRAGLRMDVDKQYADIPVCLCSFVSGLCDSTAFNAATVFVSMQTGNTIFLALGTANLPSNVPHMWLRALASIAAFLLGVYCFSKLRHIRPISKATLASNFAVQAAFIFAAAALAQTRVVPAMGDLHIAEQLAHDQAIDFRVLGPIALLAFQFGGQIVTSRQLGFNEVPTNVVTSVYCDLISDPGLFSTASNPKRNRRASAVILLLLGGIIGAWLGWSQAGMSASLWLGGFVKSIIAITWLFWKPAASK
ncbi:hypothetical protein S7711_07713 [Stachybotrys chartarum IBT 7711]|uniref:DUF1275 domain protein n=1 Tax=Stachybotrys chartarum (strain CBS 109288 / IBT 7711) TaxID=1280523 RepID=A0A084B7Y7_STACB|nr:hypothetical protein S7711_07713 [Stachybotrys chartarum IBT 7711]KFA56550.1 hypothetical protein S40293_01119 [Stachybotrys chartarum IBT 40293]KFA72635.1 hypothetical protein S40288_03405 [Stachybotrys chartarum IBT 40288]